MEIKEIYNPDIFFSKLNDFFLMEKFKLSKIT